MKIKKFSLTKRYVLALSLIALLSTLAYFNLNRLIDSQLRSGEFIDISAKQRMLSQQISFYAIYYKMENLKKRLDLMRENHKKLLNHPLSPQLEKIYYKEPMLLDKKINRYLDEAENFYEKRSGRSLTYLLTHSKDLLKDLDKVAQIYIENAQKSTNKLKQVEFYIFLLTLLTLIFEALFIFWPATKILKENMLKDRIMQEQSKFAALGEMIAIIAHQWRQPLAQLNYNNIFLKKKLKDETLKKELEDNEEIIHFMSETIKNFEDFYKKSDNTDFNPVVSINQVFKIVDSIIALRGIKIQKEFKSKMTIYANPNSLAHVILSIIQNSLDAIKLRDIKEPFINIQLFDTKDHIIIQIEDNAGGIKEEPISKIFEPFKSKKKIPSTGIGLYMSKLIIQEKFNGKIEAKNSNNGAIFTIYLPLS